jgi:hypothetical protein
MTRSKIIRENKNGGNSIGHSLADNQTNGGTRTLTPDFANSTSDLTGKCGPPLRRPSLSFGRIASSQHVDPPSIPSCTWPDSQRPNDAV